MKDYNIQLKEWKQILLDIHDGKIKFDYRPFYDVTFISGIDWDTVSTNRNFKLSRINTVYYNGKIDEKELMDIVMTRIKILMFIDKTRTRESKAEINNIISAFTEFVCGEFTIEELKKDISDTVDNDRDIMDHFKMLEHILKDHTNMWKRKIDQAYEAGLGILEP